MATGKQPSGNIDRAANVIENQADAKETHMLKFTTAERQTPPKSCCFWKKRGPLTNLFPSTHAKASSTNRNFLPSIQTPSCPQLWKGTLPFSIRALSYFISQRRPANFCPPRPTKHARNSCHGCFSCRLVSALISGNQCISETMRPKSFLTPSTVMCSKRNDMLAF